MVYLFPVLKIVLLSDGGARVGQRNVQVRHPRQIAHTTESTREAASYTDARVVDAVGACARTITGKVDRAGRAGEWRLVERKIASKAAGAGRAVEAARDEVVVGVPVGVVAAEVPAKFEGVFAVAPTQGVGVVPQRCDVARGEVAELAVARREVQTGGTRKRHCPASDLDIERHSA